MMLIMYEVLLYCSTSALLYYIAVYTAMIVIKCDLPFCFRRSLNMGNGRTATFTVGRREQGGPWEPTYEWVPRSSGLAPFLSRPERPARPLRWERSWTNKECHRHEAGPA